MKTSLYIISKYWRKHRKNAFSLILSGMLMAAIIIIMLLVIREDFAGGLDEVYDKHSAAHIVMAYYNGEEELFERVEDTFRYGKSALAITICNADISPF